MEEIKVKYISSNYTDLSKWIRIAHFKRDFNIETKYMMYKERNRKNNFTFINK